MDNETKQMFELILARLDNLDGRIQDVRAEMQDMKAEIIDIKTEMARTTTKCMDVIYGGYKMNVDKFESIDFATIKHNAETAMSMALMNNRTTEELAARVAELEKKVG